MFSIWDVNMNFLFFFSMMSEDGLLTFACIDL